MWGVGRMDALPFKRRTFNRSFPYLYAMPFFRNFTYHIDKRAWKFYFLMLALELDSRCMIPGATGRII